MSWIFVVHPNFIREIQKMTSHWWTSSRFDWSMLLSFLDIKQSYSRYPWQKISKSIDLQKSYDAKVLVSHLLFGLCCWLDLCTFNSMLWALDESVCVWFYLDCSDCILSAGLVIQTLKPKNQGVRGTIKFIKFIWFWCTMLVSFGP